MAWHAFHLTSAAAMRPAELIFRLRTQRFAGAGAGAGCRRPLLAARGQLRPGLLRCARAQRGSQPRVHVRLLKGRPVRPGGNLCGPLSRWCSTTLSTASAQAACMACISRSMDSMEHGLQLPQTSCPQTLTLHTSPSPGEDCRLAMLEAQSPAATALRGCCGSPCQHRSRCSATDTGPSVDCVRELEANCIFQSPSAPHDPRA